MNNNKNNRVNAFTVDVEEYFHVSAFENIIDHGDWANLPSHVMGSTEFMLDLLEKHNTKGTFFTLGIVAKTHPDLVRQIAARGHEVACHGLEHRRVSSQTPEQFREDIRTSKKRLEDIIGMQVDGYRAASFSMTKQTLWAFPILEEEGFIYSSSVNPIKHDHYGIPDAPRFPYLPEGCQKLLEIPITTLPIWGRRMPIGGGGYFRLMPYPIYKYLLKKYFKAETQPSIFYCHPWEVDEHQFVPQGLSFKTRFRHYVGIKAMPGKLEKLLADFRWGTMKQAFL